MTEWIINNFWATGGIILVILFIAHRIIDNKKLDQWGYGLTLWILNKLFTIGKLISTFGRTKLGKKNYEMLEKEAISWAGSFFGGCKRAWSTPGTGLINGLMVDNLKNGKTNGKATNN